jgi:transposase
VAWLIVTAQVTVRGVGVPQERWTSEAGSQVGPAERMLSWQSPRRSFTAEYRVEAAHRVIDSGRKIVEVARDLGVSEKLLGRWVKDERVRQAAAVAVPDVPDTPLTETERAELNRLRRKVTDQARQFEEQERDVASQKASAYFAAMQPK